MKAAGSILLIFGGFMAGLFKSFALSENVNILMSLEEAVILFESEIEYSLSALPDAFKKAGVCDKSGIFSLCASKILERNAADSLREAVEERRLCGEGKMILQSFAEGLHAQNKEGQIKNAELCRLRLAKAVKKAEIERDRLKKLYPALCGACALVLTVFLM